MKAIDKQNPSDDKHGVDFGGHTSGRVPNHHGARAPRHDEQLQSTASEDAKAESVESLGNMTLEPLSYSWQQENAVNDSELTGQDEVKPDRARFVLRPSREKPKQVPHGHRKQRVREHAEGDSQQPPHPCDPLFFRIGNSPIKTAGNVSPLTSSTSRIPLASPSSLGVSFDLLQRIQRLARRGHSTDETIGVPPAMDFK
jgi:hypothetical protein